MGQVAMKPALALIIVHILSLVLVSSSVHGLDPSLDVSQYDHKSWTMRDGFWVGATYAIAQTPDGYLWLGSEFGLYRFDGVKAIAWPPEGQQLPDKPYSLLVSRDGTLWIGTFAGLVSWNGTKLTQYPEIGAMFVTSLLEDREGTVWAGILGNPTGRLCAIQSGRAQCYVNDGAFGSFVWSLVEDSSGTLWVGAESGLWRWKPGTPKRYATPGMRIGDLVDEGGPVIGIRGAGLKRLVGDRFETYRIARAMNPNTPLLDREIDSNKLLRDRDGGLWIGTQARGLIRVHNGKAAAFTKSSGLSGDISCSLFEDREGNIWFASSRGLDRFRGLPVNSISAKQADFSKSVLAGTDGSLWVGTEHGLSRWKNEEATIFGKRNGLPDNYVQSLFQDYRGRVWVFTKRGLAYFNGDRFVAVPGVPDEEVSSITGDNADNLWLSGKKGLSHLLRGRLVENLPWSALGRRQQAKVVLFDPERGGIWLSFWLDGGVLYLKNGHVTSYTAANGLGKGHVPALRLDRQGALWAATEEGGLSRIKDGSIANLTTKNGLPCDTIHWSIEDDNGALWLCTLCGLVRITRSELEAWIADPKRRIETTLLDASDGMRPTAVSPAYYNPPVAKAADGKLWFHSGDAVQVVDPDHLPFNRVPPPVHVEQIIADHKAFWRNLPGQAASILRLPPGIRDLQIDYNALSLAAPEKVHFKYKLEGQDSNWREVVSQRQVQYSNLAPGPYRFRVIASNNSGVWNEVGDTREFWIAPAFYQTNWFRFCCAVFFLALLWVAYHLRVRRLRHQFEMSLEARVSERIRIARELHDTLLQSFHGLLLRFQTVSQLLPGRALEAREKLDSAIQQAADAITEGRDAVQNLRASTLQTNDLAGAINNLGQELATDSTKFDVAVEGETRNLHPILRDEVYKISAEALRNAFRHAKARRVEVEIRYDDEQFRVRVRDDGKGIAPGVMSAQVSEGHYGLQGMRERATLIGGKLTVWSEVNAGTELELLVPASAAYAKTRRRSWLARKLAAKA